MREELKEKLMKNKEIRAVANIEFTLELIWEVFVMKKIITREEEKYYREQINILSEEFIEQKIDELLEREETENGRK